MAFKPSAIGGVAAFISSKRLLRENDATAHTTYGRRLVLAGMNPEIQLEAHRKNAIARAVSWELLMKAFRMAAMRGSICP